MVTTDGEQDDMTSMIRYLAYADCFRTEGLVYSSSWFHASAPAGAPLPSPNLPVGAWGRETGTSWIQHEIELYRQEYPNFKAQDPAYPSPDSLLSVVKVGNVNGDNDMWEDTQGSDLIRSLILDQNPRDAGPLYLQSWGGLNTIARALMDIQQTYEAAAYPVVLAAFGSQAIPSWSVLQQQISDRVVIEASGLMQDQAYEYIANAWPAMRVIDGSAGYSVWAYQHQSSTTANPLPEDQLYYSGAWMKPNVVDQGPLGGFEFTYGDGHWDGDPWYTNWDDTSQPKYTFTSEGDNVAYLNLIPNGLNNASDPSYGGWGGRQALSTATSNPQAGASTNTWSGVASDTYTDGSRKANYDFARWFPAAQNNFAARMRWGTTAAYRYANHAPDVTVPEGTAVVVHPGQTIQLRGIVTDPDGNHVAVQWWQYKDAGTYPGAVKLGSPRSAATTVAIHGNAKAGQTIHLILQGTDNGTPPMTSYQRVVLTVAG